MKIKLLAVWMVATSAAFGQMNRAVMELGTNWIGGVKYFTGSVYGVYPTMPSNFATKAYVDSVIGGGGGSGTVTSVGVVGGLLGAYNTNGPAVTIELTTNTITGIGDSRYVPLERGVIAGFGLIGGGELSSDVTVSLDPTQVLTTSNAWLVSLLTNTWGLVLSATNVSGEVVIPSTNWVGSYVNRGIYTFGNTNAPAGTVWTNDSVVLVGTNMPAAGGDLSFTNASFILLGSSHSSLPNARVLDSAPDLLPTTADPWDEEFSDQSFTNRFSTRSGEAPVWKFGSGTVGLRITNATAYIVCTKAAPTGSAPWFVSAKLTGAMGGGYRGIVGLVFSNSTTNDFILGYYGLGSVSDNHPVLVRLNTNGSYITMPFGEGQSGTGLPIYWAVGYDGTNTHVYTSGLGGIWQRLAINTTLPFRPSAIGLGGYITTAAYTNHVEIDWMRVTYGGLP